MFGVISNAWTLMKASWGVVKKDKEILIFPVIAGVVFLIMFMLYVVGVFFASPTINIWAMVIGIFVIYFMGYFVVIWSNVAIIGCASIRLKGGDPNVNDGVRIANENLGAIFKWSMLSACVALFMALLRSAKHGGRLAASILGFAWNVLTFFIIPVMIYEKKGITDSMKRSGYLFSQAWGETLLGNFGFSTIIGLLALVGFIPILIGILMFNIYVIAAGFIIATVYWSILAIVGGATTAVFRAALYQYVTTGKLGNAYRPYMMYIPVPMGYAYQHYQPYAMQTPYMMPGPQMAYPGKTWTPPHQQPQATKPKASRPKAVKPVKAGNICKKCGAKLSSDSIACERCGEGV